MARIWWWAFWKIGSRQITPTAAPSLTTTVLVVVRKVVGFSLAWLPVFVTFSFDILRWFPHETILAFLTVNQPIISYRWMKPHHQATFAPLFVWFVSCKKHIAHSKIRASISKSPLFEFHLYLYGTLHFETNRQFEPKWRHRMEGFFLVKTADSILCHQ